MTVIFVGLLAFILGAVFIVNSGFLGQYYLSHKVQDLLNTYDAVDVVLEQGSLTEQSTEILYEAEKSNIDMAIVNSNAGNDPLNSEGRKPALSPAFPESVREK